MTGRNEVANVTCCIVVDTQLRVVLMLMPAELLQCCKEQRGGEVVCGLAAVYI